MTKIKLELEETDLYNSLKSIIKHSNSEEIARALTSIIAPHEKLTSIFFKTYFGGSAPPVLSEGTMVTVNPNKLSYKTNVEGMKRLGLLNISGHATAIIKLIKGGYLALYNKEVECFIPGSHAAANVVHNFNDMLGKTLIKLMN